MHPRRAREREGSGSDPAFEALEKDVGFFDKAVGLGTMRLTLKMSALTLTLLCSDMAEATEWVKHALEGAALPVRWSLED